jgi:hypothetical protein
LAEPLLTEVLRSPAGSTDIRPYALRSVGYQQRRSTMNTFVMKFLGAVGLAAVLAVTAVTSSYAQRHDPNCIPQYDTSGAQVAPYC